MVPPSPPPLRLPSGGRSPALATALLSLRWPRFVRLGPLLCYFLHVPFSGPVGQEPSRSEWRGGALLPELWVTQSPTLPQEEGCLPAAVSVSWLHGGWGAPPPLPLDHQVALSVRPLLPGGSFTPSSCGRLSHSPFYFIQAASISSFYSICFEIMLIFFHTGFSLSFPIVILHLFLSLLLLFFCDCFTFDTTK